MIKNGVTVVTEEMLMQDLDEYDKALRHNPSKVKELQKKANDLVDRYLENYDEVNYDFMLDDKAKVYDMMYTYIRVFEIDDDKFKKVRDGLSSYFPGDKEEIYHSKNAHKYYKKLIKARSIYYNKLSKIDDAEGYSSAENVEAATETKSLKDKFKAVWMNYNSRKEERKAKRKAFWSKVYDAITPKFKISRKTAFAFCATALLAVGGVLGFSKIAKASQGNSDNNNAKPVKTVNNTSRTDSLPANTLSFNDFVKTETSSKPNIKPAFDFNKKQNQAYMNILNNKNSYYQQKTAEQTAPKVATDTASAEVATQKTPEQKAVAKPTKQNNKAQNKAKVVTKQTAQTAVQDTVVNFGAYGPGGQEIVDYYKTHAVTVLGSEEARDAYYEDIFKAISDGKFEMTPNMPIEQIAHFMLVNQKVRPNSWQGKLIKKAMSQGLNEQEQQKFDNLMGEPFTICKIKGNGSHSSYNHAPKSQQVQHNKALKKALQGRMYRIANY